MYINVLCSTPETNNVCQVYVNLKKNFLFYCSVKNNGKSWHMAMYFTVKVRIRSMRLAHINSIVYDLHNLPTRLAALSTVPQRLPVPWQLPAIATGIRDNSQRRWHQRVMTTKQDAQVRVELSKRSNSGMKAVAQESRRWTDFGSLENGEKGR